MCSNEIAQAVLKDIHDAILINAPATGQKYVDIWSVRPW